MHSLTVTGTGTCVGIDADEKTCEKTATVVRIVEDLVCALCSDCAKEIGQEITTAETVSGMFGNDGHRFRSDTDDTMRTVCFGFGCRLAIDKNGNTVYVFQDGSAIVDRFTEWAVLEPFQTR